jgi:hypothetical protein
MPTTRFITALAVFLLASTAATATDVPLWQNLAQAAPTANPQAIKLAVAAMQCAVAHGVPSSRQLAVIDYSLPSTRRRLWIFNLATRRLLMRELVAHGRNSGNDLATRFSDRDGSLESSLGLYRTQATYIGDNGYSLRMQGLDPGFNNHAWDRAIVIHGAAYVSQAFARREGRIGRSWGCPAVSKRVARQVIDTLKGGQFVFAYYPDQRWIIGSSLLHCTAAARSMAAVPRKTTTHTLKMASPRYSSSAAAGSKVANRARRR